MHIKIIFNPLLTKSEQGGLITSTLKQVEQIKYYMRLKSEHSMSNFSK